MNESTIAARRTGGEGKEDFDGDIGADPVGGVAGKLFEIQEEAVFEEFVEALFVREAEGGTTN